MTLDEIKRGARLRFTPKGAMNGELRRQALACGGTVTVRDVSANHGSARCVLIDTGVPGQWHYDSLWWVNPDRLSDIGQASASSADTRRETPEEHA